MKKSRSPRLSSSFLTHSSPDLDTDPTHNAYTYANINLLKNVTITAGASFDYLERAILPPFQEERSQFNPKFGITWNPFPSTTVRAAAFRVLKRTLITDQTLEPTQVAGFNQFFDDPNVTEAWRYGAGHRSEIYKGSIRRPGIFVEGSRNSTR